jgi:CUE domain
VPESPTTAREPDFDDDTHAHDTSALAPEHSEPPAPKRVSFQELHEEAPPPKPPRPMSPQAQAEATLIEAFPSVDAQVVKAVLVASGGKVEPAFNALLSMSDPSYVAEPEEPAPPPRPPRPTATARSQLEQDEMYARQLAAHFESSAHAGFGSGERGDPPLPARRRETGLKPNEMYDDRDHSFFDGMGVPQHECVVGS